MIQMATRKEHVVPAGGRFIRTEESVRNPRTSLRDRSYHLEPARPLAGKAVDGPMELDILNGPRVYEVAR